MNYSDCLKQLITVYPIKEYDLTDVRFDWLAANNSKNEILLRFDTEIETMANIAIHEIEINTDYLLKVGSRFGVMAVLDNTENLQAVGSYYLKTGIMYGPSSKKKSQFAFELMAIANKRGVSFTDDLGKRESKGETGEVFSKLSNILRTFYDKNTN